MNEQIKRYRYNHRSLQEHGRENDRIRKFERYVVNLHRTRDRRKTKTMIERRMWSLMVHLKCPPFASWVEL